MAIDNGIPLITDIKCAKIFCEVRFFLAQLVLSFTVPFGERDILAQPLINNEYFSGAACRRSASCSEQPGKLNDLLKLFLKNLI